MIRGALLDSPTARISSRLHSLLFPAACLAILSLVMVRSAWLSDDALITFRTIDHFVNGHGLRFNLAERVQSYTHPLWLLLLAPFYFFSREAFYTPILVSLVCSGLAVLWGLGARRTRVVLATGVACLISSKAFIDYTTSGLEAPLGYLLLAIWLRLYLDPVPAGAREARARVVALLALGSLLFVNRMDSLLLIAPALATRAFALLRSEQSVRRTLGPLLLACIPAFGWLGFSLLYYGSFVPNTAYAKLGTGIDPWLLRSQGLFYLGHALRFDPVTPLVIALALAGSVADAFRRRRSGPALLALGVLLQLLYVIEIGGDFMMGRLLSLPFFVSLLVLADLPAPAWGRVALAAFCVALSLSSSLSPLRSGPGYENREEQEILQNRGISDERGFYYGRRGLLSPGRESELRAGSACRESDPRVVIRNVCGDLGYVGFTSCAGNFIADRCALSDPLLARMPMIDPTSWRVGHYFRRVPRGYRESLEANVNLLEAPRIRALYDDILKATRGPLFAGGRLSAIVRLTLGSDQARR
jgi:arabinofuranosyltransferase